MSKEKLSSVQKKNRTFNKRIPKSLEREQNGLAKVLRKERYTTEPFNALSEIFDSIDRTYSYASGLVACRKGCSSCCYMEIGLAQVEADYIAQHSGVPAKKLTYQPISSTDGWIDQNKPCPFLKLGQCSIYPYRPMTCRTYVSFEATNEKCKFDSTSTISMIDRSTSFPGLMQAYGELVRRYGGKFGDIRDFFGNSSIPLL